MSLCRSHYERAFEDYLRLRGRPYILVRDTQRAIFAGSHIKSFDFVVYSQGPKNWLVDVKGRKLALASAKAKGHLENWTTREDIEGLRQWAQVFGDAFAGMLVFAYWLTAPQFGSPFEGAEHAYAGRRYVLAAMPAQWYAQHCKPRSRRWGTLAVPAATFRRALRSVDDFL